MITELMVTKRDGQKVVFSKEKIVVAVGKAMAETGLDSQEVIDRISGEIAEFIEKKIVDSGRKEIGIEEISDMAEDSLAYRGKVKASKRYILYRHEHNLMRDKKWEMTEIQNDIWSQKYEYDKEGFGGFLDRMSHGNSDLRKLIRDKKFLFGGRILAGRGLNSKGHKLTYSNCYVLPAPEDTLESIFDTAKRMARTFSYGGGVGISLGGLRPRGSKVSNSAKETTGSVSFADLYSMVTGLIGQNSRRGALMLSMPCSHPDLEEFINIKSDLDKVTKANLSVMITSDFMEAVINNEQYKLSFTVKDTGEVIEKIVDANKVFTKLAELNHRVAEPGILWKTKIDNWHLLSEDKEFEFAGVNP
jgi:ribonucleoside-diphosphate reductase alpha chain